MCFFLDLPGWGPWQDFTPCSVQCGWGTNSKTRYCVNPSPPLNSNLQCQKIDGSQGLVETVPNNCYSGVDCMGDYFFSLILKRFMAIYLIDVHLQIYNYNQRKKLLYPLFFHKQHRSWRREIL